MTLHPVREKLARLLEIARADTKAVDPTARTFSAGRVSALEDAMKILQAEREFHVKKGRKPKPIDIDEIERDIERSGMSYCEWVMANDG